MTASLLDDHEAPEILDRAGLERCASQGALIIDGRAPEVFASGHIRGAINVPLDGRFAEYAGGVAHPGEPIVVVTEPGREVEAKVRLGRIGFDQRLRRHQRRRTTARRAPRPRRRRPPGSPPPTSPRGAATPLTCNCSTSATPVSSTPATIEGAISIPLPALRRPPRRARSDPTNRRVLRQRRPVLHRRVVAALTRLRERRRHPRRLRRVASQPGTPHLTRPRAATDLQPRSPASGTAQTGVPASSCWVGRRVRGHMAKPISTATRCPKSVKVRPTAAARTTTDSSTPPQA